MDKISPSSPSIKSSEAEKEANSQVRRAHQRIEHAQREAAQAIDRIQDQYEKQSTKNSLHQTAALEKQKLKGYEHMRDLQKEQEQGIRKQRAEGDRRLLELKKYYSGTMHQLEQNYLKAIHDLKTENTHTTHYEKSLHDLQMQALHDVYDKQIKELNSEYEHRIEQARELNQNQLEQMKQESQQATEREEEHFQKKWIGLKKKYEDTLRFLQSDAGEKLKEMAIDTAQKLSAYEKRQEDPFYQLVQLETKLKEFEDHYQLTLWIPAFEQKNITLSVQGDTLLITGYRRNETFLEGPSGKTQGTSSFQSFSETFPLEWPVDGKLITRNSEPDRLTLFIPKKRNKALPDPTSTLLKKTPQRLQGSRPSNLPHPTAFPKNLPLEKTDRTSDAKSAQEVLFEKISSGTLG